MIHHEVVICSGNGVGLQCNVEAVPVCNEKCARLFGFVIAFSRLTASRPVTPYQSKQDVAQNLLVLTP